MKYIKIALVSIVLPSVSFATGLSFQTLAPSAGDILTSISSEIDLTSTVRFGTLSGNANFASGTSAYSTFSAYDSAFTSLLTGNVVEGTPNNITGTASSGTFSAGLNLWLLVGSGSEFGVYFVGETPSLSSLSSNPQAIISNATIALGNSSGSNLLLVPEPSAYAAIAGLMTLGFVMVRRRRA
jgi:hypothetical protein